MEVSTELLVADLAQKLRRGLIDPHGPNCEDDIRAMNPQEGDWLECGDARIDVKSVDDGKVWHDITTPKAIYNREMNLNDWPRTIKNALEKGAKFHARLNRLLEPLDGSRSREVLPIDKPQPPA